MAVLAHRGGSGPWRENSLEAFSAALLLGADGVELDVRRSAEGELVVHHDAEIPGAGLIHECRHDQFPAWVPTLADALAVCGGAIVNVEIKNIPTDPGYDPADLVASGVASLLARQAEAAPQAPGADRWPARILVSSFWPDALAAVGRSYGDAALGLLVHPALDAVSGLDTAGALGCVALHPHHSQVTPELVAHAHGRGLAIATWTVNSPGEIDSVVAAGVDIVITDSVTDTLGHLGRH